VCDKNRTSARHIAKYNDKGFYTEIGGGEVDCVTGSVKKIRFSYLNKDTKGGEKDEGGQARDDYILHAYVSRPRLATRHNRLRREGHMVD
jgi:hypothetical protein